MKNISAVIVCKNEEEILAKCLKNLLWVDEIIFVDNQSQDLSLEIAKKYTTKYFSSRIRNLGKLKQLAITLATSKWILIIDSDELVTTSLRKEITKIVRNPKTKLCGFLIPFRNYFFGKKINFGGENYSQLRLFKKRKGKILQKLVHEKVIVKGKTGRLNNYIVHYSYRNTKQVLRKFHRYAKLTALQKIKKNEKVTLNKLMLYPAHMFISRFILSKGYKDGFAGLYLALLFAYMEFLNYLYLLRLHAKFKMAKSHIVR